MPTLIVAAVAVLVLYLLLQMFRDGVLRTFRTANRELVTHGLKVAGGLAALGAAALIGVRGNLAVAIPLGVFGAGLLGWSPAGVPLLEGYLDRWFPARRQNAQGDGAGRYGRAPATGKMTEQEAYEILGLQPGARSDDIRRAHRGLMKKLHPDQGGSTYLAARVNEAKDTLLRTHNG